MQLLRPVVVAILSLCLQSAQADSLPFSVPKANPKVVLTTDAGSTIAFGPVQLAFPVGWSFASGSNPWKGTAPSGLVALVSVLSATQSTLQAGVVTPQQRLASQARMSSDVGLSCGLTEKVIVHSLLDEDRKVVYVAGCEERRGGETQFAVQYEMLSERGIVQLTAAGNGNYEHGRKVFDQIALGHRWQGDA
jgi:hypothetical protein